MLRPEVVADFFTGLTASCSRLSVHRPQRRVAPGGYAASRQRIGF
jgi:hypothetical protein